MFVDGERLAFVFRSNLKIDRILYTLYAFVMHAGNSHVSIAVVCVFVVSKHDLQKKIFKLFSPSNGTSTHFNST